MEKLFLNSAIAIAKVLACSRARSSQMSTRCIQITISPFKIPWCPMNYHYVSWWNSHSECEIQKNSCWNLLMNHHPIFHASTMSKNTSIIGPMGPGHWPPPSQGRLDGSSHACTTKDAEKTMVSWVWNIINVHNSNFTRKKWLVIQPQKWAILF